MADKKLVTRILRMCILFVALRLGFCSCERANANSKAKKYHPPPPAHYMHSPPETVHASQPPLQVVAPRTPAAKPGQAPLATVESAAAFTLYHGRNFKVIQNLLYDSTYLLLQQTGESDGKDWDLNIGVFPDPLANFTLDTNSAVAFLELLGCVGKLKGVPLSLGLASTCTFQLILQGAIATLELTDNIVDLDDASSSPTFEALFGSSKSLQSPTNYQNQSNFVSFDAYLDRGPLQRAEWIKFLASFVDMEERANIVYEKIQSNYQCLNASQKGNNLLMPLVAWLKFNVDLGIWTFSNDPYNLQLTLDAGGINLDALNLSASLNMSIIADVQEFHMITSTLDVVIDETPSPDPSTYTLDNMILSAKITDLSGFRFLANKQLWRSDKRIGINNAPDWTEGAIAQPQIVLRDLIEIFHPAANEGRDYGITYFRNIATGESFVNTTASKCQRVDMTSALDPTIIPCTNQTRF